MIVRVHKVKNGKTMQSYTDYFHVVKIEKSVWDEWVHIEQEGNIHTMLSTRNNDFKVFI